MYIDLVEKKTSHANHRKSPEENTSAEDPLAAALRRALGYHGVRPTQAFCH